MGIKKNYIFTNKRYSEKSVMSTILGLISLGALIAAVYFTLSMEECIRMAISLVLFRNRKWMQVL